jgi:hypothetical protein
MSEFVYRTTKTIPCPTCGAQTGESCHLQSGQFAGFGVHEKFHLERVDIDSQPVGTLEPSRPGSAVQRIIPIKEGDP